MKVNKNMRIVCNKKIMIPVKQIQPGSVFYFGESYYMKLYDPNHDGECCAVSLLDGLVYKESFFKSNVAYEPYAELHVINYPDYEEEVTIME